MHKIIAFGLLASLATATPSLAAYEGLCGPDGPEAYKRPGGYCDILRGNGSLSSPGSDAASGNIPAPPAPADKPASKPGIFSHD